MKSAFELSEFDSILQMFLPHVVTHAGPLFEALQLPEQRSRSGALSVMALSNVAVFMLFCFCGESALRESFSMNQFN